MRHSPWRWTILGATGAIALSLGAQLLVVLAGLPWLPDTNQPGIRVGGALSFAGATWRNAAVAAALAGAAWVLRRSRFSLATLGVLAGAALVHQVELLAVRDVPDFLWLPGWVPLLGGGVADLADVLVVLAATALTVAVGATAVLAALRPACRRRLA